MNNEHAGSECSEGCAGFKPLPGNSWSNYGICKKRGSPNQGFPVQRGRTCRAYFPQGSAPAEPVLKPNGDSTASESH